MTRAAGAWAFRGPGRESRRLESSMRELLKGIVADSKCWLELRAHERRALSVLVRKGVVESAAFRTVSGVGARVLVNGTWGFSSVASFERDDVLRAARDAVEAATMSSSGRLKGVGRLQDCALAVGDFRSGNAAGLAARSTEEKTALAVDTEARIRASSPAVLSATARYSEIIDRKWIVSTDGADARIEDSKAEFVAGAVAGEGDRMTTAFRGTGVTGGLDDLFATWSPEGVADHVSRIAVDLLSAPYAPAGEAVVVLDPEIVGLLAHEAVGHTVEADFVLSGSAASGRIGRKVASELVTLVDSGPALIGSPTAGGVVLVDDEGVPTGRTVIIDRGVLRSYLHDRETAALFDVPPTGNARAWQFDDEPIIRMRNTYIEPGASSLEEVIASVEHGFLLRGAEGGQADANAEFMFGVQEAYEITNGKVGRLFRGATISGDAFEVLAGVDMLSSGFEWGLGSGACGKGQAAKVDGGGPHVRCRVMLGGR
jgi:TldD protein